MSRIKYLVEFETHEEAEAAVRVAETHLRLRNFWGWLQARGQEVVVRESAGRFAESVVVAAAFREHFGDVT